MPIDDVPNQPINPHIPLDESSKSINQKQHNVHPNSLANLKTGGKAGRHVSIATRLRKSFLKVFEENYGVENFAKVLQMMELHDDRNKVINWKWATEKILDLIKAEKEQEGDKIAQVIVNKIVMHNDDDTPA